MGEQANGEIRITKVPPALKRELYVLVEQKQKALGGKRYSLSELVVEILEAYVRENGLARSEAEQREFLRGIAQEVAKVGSLEGRMDRLIQAVNQNTITLQELLEEL